MTQGANNNDRQNLLFFERVFLVGVALVTHGRLTVPGRAAFAEEISTNTLPKATNTLAISWSMLAMVWQISNKFGRCLSNSC